LSRGGELAELGPQVCHAAPCMGELAIGAFDGFGKLVVVGLKLGVLVEDGVEVGLKCVLTAYSSRSSSELAAASALTDLGPSAAVLPSPCRYSRPEREGATTKWTQCRRCHGSLGWGVAAVAGLICGAPATQPPT
jgi:hypothetical protein